MVDILESEGAKQIICALGRCGLYGVFMSIGVFIPATENNVIIFCNIFIIGFFLSLFALTYTLVYGASSEETSRK